LVTDTKNTTVLRNRLNKREKSNSPPRLRNKSDSPKIKIIIIKIIFVNFVIKKIKVLIKKQ